MGKEVDKKEWYLESLKLDFQKWGDNKGKYEGKITFQNREYESFSFRIKPEMAQQYIKLIAKDVVAASERLSEDLVNSLKLKNLEE